MRVAMFSAKPYDQSTFAAANATHGHDIRVFEERLRPGTAFLATGSQAVCIFVNDVANEDVLGALHELGVRHIVLRCAGFNNVDLAAAARLDLTVARVPAHLTDWSVSISPARPQGLWVPVGSEPWSHACSGTFAATSCASTQSIIRT
jgi:lactate dehydrogenase-like 2-hydroxyacid dehydrogenase